MYERILIPTDGSTGTTHVAMEGIQLAKQSHGTVHVIHVVDSDRVLPGSSETEDELYDQGERAIDRVRAIAATHDVPVETVMRDGNPSEEIVNYADEIEADVIVAGTHGRTGLDRHLIGSTAERIVRYASCPVMTIRLPNTDVTVESDEEAGEVAHRAIEEQGYEATVDETEARDGMWVVEAQTDGGRLRVYIDAITQRTMVLELD